MVSLYYKLPFEKGQTELWKSVMPKYFHTNVSMCASTADFDLLFVPQYGEEKVSRAALVEEWHAGPPASIS